MDVKLTKATEAEADDAKEFWAGTEFQGKEYGERGPPYAETVCHIIQTLKPASVFEFGCNAGRNLELLRSKLEGGTPRLAGVDINTESIAHGRNAFPRIDLRVADESYLEGQPERSWDVVFTISVLDHLPAVDDTLAQLARITDRVLLLLEPHGQKVGRVDAYREDGADAAWKDATPFSYLHDYDALLAALPFDERMNVALPTGDGRLGPLYRLRVLERAGGTEQTSDGMWNRQVDHIVREAVLGQHRAQAAADGWKRKLDDARAENTSLEHRVEALERGELEMKFVRARRGITRRAAGALRRLVGDKKPRR